MLNLDDLKYQGHPHRFDGIDADGNIILERLVRDSDPSEGYVTVGNCVDAVRREVEKALGCTVEGAGM